MLFRPILLVVLALGFQQPAQRRHVVLPGVTPLRVGGLKEIVHRDSGNVVFVNVWATWCKPCKEEMPNLVRLRKEFLDKRFSLILVSADDSELVDTKVRPALQSLGVDFPSYIINEKSDDAFIGGMDSSWNGALPTTFVYGRNGILTKIMTGEKSYSQFDTTLRALLLQ